jgi:hypothetical protein
MVSSDKWVDTLVCNGFELYGTLYEGSAQANPTSVILPAKNDMIDEAVRNVVVFIDTLDI